MPFAVVDLETTGLFPKTNRVVEIAVVRLADDCTVTSEWATLVNPGRDVGPTHIHGITASDVRDAPRFEDIVGDVGRALEHCVLVAHNMRFDLGFLEAEIRRARSTMPSVVSLCTLNLAYEFEPDGAERKLASCCQRAGIPIDTPHSALHDARLVARLFDCYMMRAMKEGARSVMEKVHQANAFPKEPWPELPRPSGRCLARAAARALAAMPQQTYLERLVGQLTGDEAPGPVEAEYLNLLDRALEDRRITPDESQGLLDEAKRFGLSASRVHGCHHLYLATLVRSAKADGVVTAEERRDLQLVADLLGIAASALDALLPVGRAAAPPAVAALLGKRICFTGESACKVNGFLLTRVLAEELAERKGVLVVSAVSKRTDFVVAANLSTASGKARKAREYGIPFLSERDFWTAIGVAVE